MGFLNFTHIKLRANKRAWKFLIISGLTIISIIITTIILTDNSSRVLETISSSIPKSWNENSNIDNNEAEDTNTKEILPPLKDINHETEEQKINRIKYEFELKDYYDELYLEYKDDEEIEYKPPVHRLEIHDDNLHVRVPINYSDPIEIEKIKENPNLLKRESATFISLVRNSEVTQMVRAIRTFEKRFNQFFHYDWIFLNDEKFTDEVIDKLLDVCSGKVKFGLVTKDQWSYPDWINQTLAYEHRQKMEQDGIIYGGSESYRHMCRYQSGFFWRHPLLSEYKYYWRVEPATRLFCNIDYDIFRFMKENDKKYGFTISMYEFMETVETLWDSTLEFINLKNNDYKKKISKKESKNNLLKFVSDDGGKSFNGCHFWSNFEIADLDVWRSQKYTDYFNYLDKKGGFFYERWGDAPVHSIFASIFLKKDQIHLFNDFGYYHAPNTVCPSDPEIRMKNKCTCRSTRDMSFGQGSCTPKFYEAQGFKYNQD